MKKFLLFIFTLNAVCVYAQINRLGNDIEMKVTAQGSAGNGDVAPFWFTSNRYGLGPSESFSGLTRVSLIRGIENDSIRNWGIGYGVDMAGAYSKNHTRFVLQQAFFDVKWKMLRLSLGQKERPSELKNENLSIGGLTLGTNARPLPQIRFELPDFWSIPGTKGWLAIKAHIAYGWYTDNAWQRNNNASTDNYYTSGSRFHSKAGFLRIGNKDVFPLTLTGGLEMAAQFGGTSYNFEGRGGDIQGVVKHNSGIKAYWNAFIMGGSDANDGDKFKNVAGNHIGSWHLRLDFHGKGWGAGVYAEHMFEDHSQLFWQYAWKDMLIGAEVKLPKNRFVSTLVYEHLRTTHQSGPIYHDKTNQVPLQISARDNYYNNHIYGSWQHAGNVMGCPLIISPLYNNLNLVPGYDNTGSLRIKHNRIIAHHVGLQGNPLNDLSYRIIYTYEKSWGTYLEPVADPMTGHFILVEAKYNPHQVRGLEAVLSYGHNGGNLLGKSDGVMLTVAYSGLLNLSKRTK